MSGKVKFTYEQYWRERISRSKDNVTKEKTINEIFETASSDLRGRGTLTLFYKKKYRYSS